MSKLLYITFRGDGFWAYDVASSVFLKFLIDAASERVSAGADHWLVDAVHNWRISAVISELAHYADDEWSQSQINTVIELSQVATEKIRCGGDIPASEIEAWPILDSQRIFARGHDPVPCEPVARLGDAFIALLQNALPKPPQGQWWFFTLKANADTIPMRADA